MYEHTLQHNTRIESCRIICNKAMRNRFFMLLGCSQNSGLPEFQTNVITGKYIRFPNQRNYMEVLNGTNGTVLLLR